MNILDKVEVVEHDGTSQSIALDLSLAYHVQALSPRQIQHYELLFKKNARERGTEIAIDLEGVTMIKLTTSLVSGNLNGFPQEVVYAINEPFGTLLTKVNRAKLMAGGIQ